MAQHQHQARENKNQFLAAAQLVTNTNAIRFQDNRPRAVLQRKQVAAMLNAPVQKKVNNTGLPNQLKSGIENLSGHSMDDVKVHYNSDKPAQLNAHAYAQGTDIHIASGQEKHLPHEAWHVVQQKEGRVKPTMQLKGKVNVNDDKGLEKEADVMGAKAMGNQITQMKEDKKNIGITSFQNVTQLTKMDDAQAQFTEHTNEFKATVIRFAGEKKGWGHDPDGLGATGLDHWAKETRLAALREYNELRYVRDKAPTTDNLRLGTSNKTDPDVIGKQKGKDVKYHIEVKTTNSTTNSSISKLVVKALKQLEARAPGPGSTWYARVALYIVNPACTWPFAAGTQAQAQASSDANFLVALKTQASIETGSANYKSVNDFKLSIQYGKTGNRDFDVDISKLK